jgi:hypothetical protein
VTERRKSLKDRKPKDFSLNDWPQSDTRTPSTLRPLSCETYFGLLPWPFPLPWPGPSERFPEPAISGCVAAGSITGDGVGGSGRTTGDDTAAALVGAVLTTTGAGALGSLVVDGSSANATAATAIAPKTAAAPATFRECVDRYPR